MIRGANIRARVNVRLVGIEDSHEENHSPMEIGEFVYFREIETWCELRNEKEI